jgi:hypothetical protein
MTGSATSRRRIYRRRRLMALAVACILVAGAVLMITRATVGGRPAAAPTAHGGGPATNDIRSTTTTAPPPPTITTDPGVLPQTGAFPVTTSTTFATNMAALWNGVSTGTAQDALPGFLPESAYLQLKAVPSPQSDYSDRLVAEYEADVVAAHRLLGPDPSASKLVGVDVDAAYAHWVPPGSCYNSVGYFELPNSRVVYSVNGQIASFGIASMISWRGEWYVVHLGPMQPSGSGGQVDSPASGPGSPTYSSTC